MKSCSQDNNKKNKDIANDVENLKLFKNQFNLMLNLFHELTKDSEIFEKTEVREQKIFRARNLWIDLMMQMQENKGVEAMSTPKYFSILDKLNKSMCIINSAF